MANPRTIARLEARILERAARMDVLIKEALERDRAIQAQGTAPEDDEDGDWEKEYETFAEGDEPPVPPPIPPKES